MATSYTTTKAALNEIAQRTEGNRKALDNAKAAIAAALADLTAMQTQYAGIVSDLDASATANPTDPAWQAAKHEKDLMVADFQAQRARANSLNTSVQE